MAAQVRIGEMEMEAKIIIFEHVIKTSLLYNIEAWSNIRKSDYEKLEVLQGRILKGIFGLPQSTPYWGILFEFEILPARLEIWYRKLMLYHGIINSDDDRIAKQIFIEQEDTGQEKCWFSELKEIGLEIGMEVGRERASLTMKSEWKKEAKSKIRKIADEIEQEKIKTMPKMRFLEKRAIDTYINELHNEMAKKAVKIRLNMIEFIKNNFGMRVNCLLCGEEDSTEHVLACRSIAQRVPVTTDDLKRGTNMEEIVNRFEEMRKRRDEKIKEDTEKEIAELVADAGV